MPHKLLANLLVFARTLRASGVSVRAGGVPDAIRALDEVGVTRRRDVRDALRTVLVSRHEDFVRFDQLFEQFWRVWPETPGSLPQPMRVPTRTRSTVRMLAPGTASAARDDRQQVSSDIPVAVRTYSPNEARRQKDFAAFTPDDLA